jgi:hypothetical protein
MTARVRPDFVGPECHNVDRHNGIRYTVAEIKQHLIDVHGFVYDDESSQRTLRRTCPHCGGEGWIERDADD